MDATPKRIAIAVVERGAEVLIGQRSPEMALGGLWEFPGGKVETDESFEDATVRECLEETGLRVKIVGEFPSVVHSYEHATVQLRFFRCEVVPPTSVPANAFRWVHKSALAEFEFPAANADLLATLQSECCKPNADH